MKRKYYLHHIIPFSATIISAIIFVNNYFTSIEYYLGIILTVVGLTFWWEASSTIGESFSLLPTAKELITYGIYSKFRHPIYIGVTLTLFGWALLTMSLIVLIVAILSVALSIIRAHYEEEVLTKKFGKEYTDYKKKTWF